MLGQLQRAQARLTAVNAAVLAAFTAQGGYEPDGHRSARAWLINKTGISAGAASGAGFLGGRRSTLCPRAPYDSLDFVARTSAEGQLSGAGVIPVGGAL